MAHRLLAGQSAVNAPRELTRYNHTKQRYEFFRAFVDGYSGYLPADAQYGSGGVAKRFSHFDYTSVTDETGATSGKWHAVFELYELTGNPNQSSAIAEAIAKSGVQVDAKYRDCATLLRNAPAPSREATKAILVLINMIDGQANTIPSSTVSGDDGCSSMRRIQIANH